MNNNYPIKVSVVIPMYNCDDFAQEMLENMSAQTLDEIEVICVIDGASELTEDIVKNHCRKDTRFIYIYQKNGGAGKARNTGLDIAKGKYVIALDIDDLYSLGILEHMYTIAEKTKADITICSFILKNYREGSSFNNLGFDRNIFFGKESGSGCEAKKWSISVWNRLPNKLYRREFLNENKLRCSETIVGNDIFLDNASYCIAERIAVIRKDLLTERRFYNSGSITSNSSKHNEQIFLAWQQLWNFLAEKGLDSDYLKEYCMKFMFSMKYRAEAEYNPAFVKEAARALCALPPWNYIGYKRFLSFYGKDLTLDHLKARKKELENEMESAHSVSQQSAFQLMTLKNTIFTISEIKKTCKELYGKDFF